MPAASPFAVEVVGVALALCPIFVAARKGTLASTARNVRDGESPSLVYFVDKPNVIAIFRL